MLALLLVCLKENQEERLACMRALLLAADLGVVPPANSPSVDFILWLTACRPNERGGNRFFYLFFILLSYLYVYIHVCLFIYLIMFLEGCLTRHDTACCTFCSSGIAGMEATGQSAGTSNSWLWETTPGSHHAAG